MTCDFFHASAALKVPIARYVTTAAIPGTVVLHVHSNIPVDLFDTHYVQYTWCTLAVNTGKHTMQWNPMDMLEMLDILLVIISHSKGMP